MKPPPFEYVDPTRTEEALNLLKDYGEEAKILAGGQSLVPLLNFRLARPRYLIDLNRISELARIGEWDGGLTIGAMTRQRAVEKSEIVRAKSPLLHDTVPFIGHFQIRNRGTVGGSLAHADPAGELPAATLALGAHLVVRRADRERILRPEEFFVGYLTTALASDELLVEIRIPPPPPRTGHAFLEVSRRHGDFALVGVAVLVTLDEDDVCTQATLAFAGAGPIPCRVPEAERLLVGSKPDQAVLEAVERTVGTRLSPDSDIHASAEYRKAVAGVLARRGLARAVELAKRART